MRRKARNERKKLLPLRVIAKESPYTIAYLSVLVQRGKLKAERVGRNFYTTREWYRQYLKMHAREDKLEEQKEIKSKVKSKRANQSASISKTPHNGRLWGFLFRKNAGAKPETAVRPESGAIGRRINRIDGLSVKNPATFQPSPLKIALEHKRTRNGLKSGADVNAGKSGNNVKGKHAHSMAGIVPARVGWISRIFGSFLALGCLMIAGAKPLPFKAMDANAAMVGENYVIYDSVMYSFDGPIITGVACSSVDEGIRVTWTTDHVADSYVIYDTAASLADSHEQGISAKTTSHDVTVSGLSPSTTYYYKVKSKRNNGGVTTDSTVRTCVSGGTAAASSTTQVIQQVSGGGGILIIDKADKFPPEVTAVELLDLASESAKLRWKTDEDATSFSQYGKDLSYGSIFGEWASTTEHEVIIRDLEPDTEYHMRALSSDAHGNVGYSKDVVFKTKPGTAKEPLKPGEKPADLSGQNKELLVRLAEREGLLARANQRIRDLLARVGEGRETGEATVIIGDPKVEVEAKKAVITWRTTTDANSLVAIAPEERYAPGSPEPYLQAVGNADNYVKDHSVTVYNLEPNKLYHFQVRSKTENGPTARTKDYTFQTKAETLVITNYYIKIIDTHTAAFKWITNGEADSAVRFTPYRGSKLSVDESKTIKDNAKSALHDLTIDEFKEGVTYEIELSSEDSAGNIARQNIPIFSTSEEDRPPEISRIQTNSTVFLDKGNKIQTIISWLTNEPATSQIYYQEGVMDIATSTAEKTSFVEDYAREHVIVITAFKPGTVYSFRVESHDSGGNVALSENHTFMTPKRRESILDMILRILEDMFGWVKNIY